MRKGDSMKRRNYLFFYSFINLLTFFPYILFVSYGESNSWYPMLFFYIMMYTANFWLILFDFQIFSSLLSLKICLLFGLIGSLLVFIGYFIFEFSIVGALLIGICVNFISFLSGNVKKQFKSSKRLDLYQILETIMLALFAFGILTQSVQYSFLLLALGFALAMQCLTGLSEKSNLKISKPKVTYTTLPKLIGLFGVTSLLFLLKMSRSTPLKFNVWMFLLVIGTGVLINTIEIRRLRRGYMDTVGHIFYAYSFIQGALSTLCILYVSFSTIIFSSPNRILFTLSLPILFAVLTGLFLGNRIVYLSPKIILFTNSIGVLITAIPSLISIGTFISFLSNSILMRGVYLKYNYLLIEAIPSPGIIHYFSKVGSLIAQILLISFYLLSSSTHGSIKNLMIALGKGKEMGVLPFLEIGLIMSVVIIVGQFNYFRYKV